MILAVALLLLASFNSSAADPAPRIELSEYSWHLGTHPQDTVVYHDLFIYNTGTADLVVNDIDASCACTVLDKYEYPVVIPPGGNHTANISYMTLDSVGEDTKYIHVHSNDTSNLTVTASFLCNVTPPDSNSTPVTFTFTVTTTTTQQATPTTTVESPATSVVVFAAAFTAALIVLRKSGKG